jgi:hypothetical protein
VLANNVGGFSAHRHVSASTGQQLTGKITQGEIVA